METSFTPTGGCTVPSSTTSEIKETNSLPPQEENAIKNGAENALNVLSYFVLIVGVITAIIMLIVGLSKVSHYRSEEEGTAMILSAGSLLFGAIVSFYVLKVFRNISNNLHEINMKIKK